MYIDNPDLHSIYVNIITIYEKYFCLILADINRKDNLFPEPAGPSICQND